MDVDFSRDDTALSSPPVVVVGASVAGVRTAQALRRLDPGLPIVLIGEEDEHPYDKPMLSKQFLSEGAEHHLLVTPAALEKSGVQFRRGVRAEALDRARQTVRLDNGDDIAYRAVVVATGASPRPLPWPGLDAAHVLRDLASARRLRRALDDARHVAVVGGGFIGSEVSAAARRLGCEVTIVDAEPVPLARVAGPTIGTLLAGVHAAHGVRTRFGVPVEAVRAGTGAVEIDLADGTTVRADLLVVGIGVQPNTGWLGSSGLDTTDGVLCDEFGRASGDSHVFAVGDVARWRHPGTGQARRAEHWTNAVDQAAAVARHIVTPDHRQPFTPSGYVWSDQYDWKIQFVGQPRPDVEPLVLGDTGIHPPRFAALYPDDRGGLAAAITVNWAWAGLAARRAIDAGDDAAAVADRITERLSRA